MGIMRLLLCFTLLACSWVHASAGSDFITDFFKAKKMEDSAPEAAIELYAKSFEGAISAGNTDYATSAGLKPCFILHEQGKTAEAGQLARKIIDALHSLPTDLTENDVIRRCELFGFFQRGLYREGRIGEAWRANRAAAETLRGRKVAANADGPALAVVEVVALPPNLHGLGWSMIDQEARLMDSAGNTVAAVKLLDEAAEAIQARWESMAPNPRFYAFKVLGIRAELTDFLGDSLKAIQQQQEQFAMSQDVPVLARSRMIVRLNVLRNLSQWQGPSTDLLEQAREISQKFKGDKVNSPVFRLLAKMELDLHESPEAIEALRADSASNAKRKHWFDAAYSDRDLLVSRANLGEDHLDSEFNRLLIQFRAQGSKSGEPTLYREYGNYLLDRDRPAEAIPMFGEALRLTRLFGWTLHEAGLLFPLFKARLAAGDLAGARATLGELEALLATHPEMPAARRVAAEVGIAMAHSSLGEKDAARAALTRARSLATDLPDYQKRWLTPAGETEILDDSPTSGTAPSAPSIHPPLRVQPVEIVSVAPPAGSARTRFTVFNPGNRRISGNWVLTGPAAAVSQGSASFTAGQPITTLKLPQILGAGDAASLGAAVAASSRESTATVTVAWQNPEQDVGTASTWRVSWDAAATRSVVLDASALEANPFRFATLHHELSVPLGEDLGVAFRLRSPVPLRFEYYDALSQQLLAIDANGNGDFTETGDLHLRSSDGIAAAIVPVSPGSSQVAVEIHIFTTEGVPLITTGSTLVMKAETYQNGGWIHQAEDTLR